MGYYLNGIGAQGKADTLIKNYGAMEIGPEDYPKDISTAEKEGYAIVVVIENGPFDAAGLAYSNEEFQEFLNCGRPFRVLMMDKPMAHEMAKYK